MTRSASQVAMLSLATLLLAAALAACSYGTRIADRSVAGPLNAIALAPVRPHEIAVLAGEAQEKSVSIFFDTPGGAEQGRFPVSKYASQISTQRARGGFLLAIAPPEGRGAIEQWTAEGDLKQTVFTSRPVLALTDELNGIVYALTDGVPKGRAAVPIRLSDGRAFDPIPLPDGTASLEICRLAGRPVLLAEGGRGDPLTVVPVETGEWIGTVLTAKHVACLTQRESIVGIESHSLTRSVVFLQLRRDEQRIRSIVAPPDAVDLATADDGTIFILRVTGTESRIDVWHTLDTAMLASQ